MLRSFHLICAMALMLPFAAPAARAQGAADPTLFVIRYIEATPEARTRVPALLKQLAQESRKEAGVVRFEILQRTAPSSQFATLEVWKDQQALDAHMASAHNKQFVDQVQPLLLAPIDERLCIAADVSPPPTGRQPRGTRYVITHVDVGPPNRDATIPMLKMMAQESRKDDGNLRFDALQQKARTNHFKLVEVWRNAKADEAHEATAHMKEFRAKLAPLIGALFDRRWYRPL